MQIVIIIAVIIIIKTVTPIRTAIIGKLTVKAAVVVTETVVELSETDCPFIEISQTSMINSPYILLF